MSVPLPTPLGPQNTTGFGEILSEDIVRVVVMVEEFRKLRAMLNRRLAGRCQNIHTTKVQGLVCLFVKK